MADLAWLQLAYDEGPGVGGPYAPYAQSQRTPIYQEYLVLLQAKNLVYPCFCSTEELEKKRERQRVLKLPPRYDRACLRLTESERAALLQKNTPFIWRFKLSTGTVAVEDMGRGVLTYDLKHFSDFPLSRQDGSFTFIFANFVDDLIMKITHIIRGEDHLSNTALQAALYEALDQPVPLFWHLPTICNNEGKKLSKRDFGFSLTDLHQAGFLPEAIDNYLAIIGGSFEHEIMSLAELISIFNFNNLASSGPIKYDLEKLRWVNHKWLERLAIDDLASRCRPYLIHAYPAVESLDYQVLEQLIAMVRTEVMVMHDIVPALAFYFKQPQLVPEHLKDVKPVIAEIIAQCLQHAGPVFSGEHFLEFIKKAAQEAGLATKEIFSALRLALTGGQRGPGIKELLVVLPAEEAYGRLSQFVNQVRGK